MFMVKSLYTVVRKVILPKYPWIKDFVWTSHYSEGTNYYSLELTVDNDFFVKNPDSLSIYNDLVDDTKMLFNLLGPDKDMKFDDVVILPDK